MQNEQATTAAVTKRDLLDTLIREKLGKDARYTFFFTTGEGRYLPDTLIEETAGYVLDDAGRAYYFWLGWDLDVGAPALTRWRETIPEPRWAQIGEYQRARARLGLS